MNKPNFSAQQQEVKQAQPEARRFGPCTPSGVLDFLWNRGQAWEDDELKFLSASSECASHMAHNLADTVSNLGCVINADYQPGKMRAGNFEMGDNVASLMFVIADQVRVIAALSNIGSEAEYLLRQRGASHV